MNPSTPCGGVQALISGLYQFMPGAEFDVSIGALYETEVAEVSLFESSKSE
jgi:hypothetical protein